MSTCCVSDHYLLQECNAAINEDECRTAHGSIFKIVPIVIDAAALETLKDRGGCDSLRESTRKELKMCYQELLEKRKALTMLTDDNEREKQNTILKLEAEKIEREQKELTYRDNEATFRELLKSPAHACTLIEKPEGQGSKVCPRRQGSKEENLEELLDFGCSTQDSVPNIRCTKSRRLQHDRCRDATASLYDATVN